MPEALRFLRAGRNLGSLAKGASSSKRAANVSRCSQIPAPRNQPIGTQVTPSWLKGEGEGMRLWDAQRVVRRGFASSVLWTRNLKLSSRRLFELGPVFLLLSVWQKSFNRSRFDLLSQPTPSLEVYLLLSLFLFFCPTAATCLPFSFVLSGRNGKWKWFRISLWWLTDMALKVEPVSH